MSGDTTSLGVGGALFLTALGLLLKYRPWDNGGKRKLKASGDLDPAEWDARIIKDNLEAQKQFWASTADVRRDEIGKIVEDKLRDLKRK